MRFMHIADVHLGAAPDAGFPWQQERAQEIWDGFAQVVAQAKDKKIDLLLIAGDLFHRQPTMKELKEVNYLFSEIPDTEVVLIAGNHDYIQERSAYLRFSWADNVHGLWNEEPECIYLDKLQTYVYGFSYHSREIREEKYGHMKANGKPGNHILLAHGGDAAHIPIKAGTFRNAGFDYAALGHIHKPGALLEHRAVYSGALEPLDRNDTGEHGYILGKQERGQVMTKFISSARRSYIPLEIHVFPEMTQLELEAKIIEEIQRFGTQNIYQLYLVGIRDGNVEFQKNRIYRLGNVIEVDDMTEPDYDFEQLEQEFAGTFLSAYIRSFPQERSAVENKALYYGVQALLNSMQT